jgi:hypothetical protein
MLPSACKKQLKCDDASKNANRRSICNPGPLRSRHGHVPETVDVAVGILPAAVCALTDPSFNEEKLMEARKAAAQFAAYVWYENTQKIKPSEDDKAWFAKEYWTSFLPVAPEGLGRLLVQIGAGRPSKVRTRKQPYPQKLAAVG